MYFWTFQFNMHFARTKYDEKFTIAYVKNFKIFFLP